MKITKGYYKLKHNKGTLCFRVLSVGYRSDKYTKVKIDWWNQHNGTYWGNHYGLSRNWKITDEVAERFERFRPEWETL